jgi:transposase
MFRGPSGKITFKRYEPYQKALFPLSLEERITPDHLVRVVSSVIDQMNIGALLTEYRGGGTSAYHPKMLLKVLVYGYIEGIYSSRRIAKALRENIHFMWLAGENQPDFRTIARFRSSRLRATIDEVFASVMELLVEAQVVQLKAAYVDGTKMEANANRYSYIWRKTKDRHEQALRKKIAALLAEIDDEDAEENRNYGDRDLEEVDHEGTITAEKLTEKVAALNERLKETPEDKTLQKAVKTLETDYQPRLERYEAQEEMLGERNSCSKTDPDATFMRMKEDHQQKGQLKPAYNLQLSTENHFILGYSLHQNAGDSTLLIPHLEKLKQILGRLPEATVADGGYGSEENYHWMHDRTAAYIKYNTFEQERTGKLAKSRFKSENWPYDPQQDVFICPAGKVLSYVETVSVTSTTGFESERRRYQASGCQSCPFKQDCLRGESDRTVLYGPTLAAHRALARDRLHSPQGVRYRSRRGVEVEGAFAQIKHNMGFRRFLLRGLNKVNVECGLLAIAHNLKRWWTLLQKLNVENGLLAMPHHVKRWWALSSAHFSHWLAPISRRYAA